VCEATKGPAPLPLLAIAIAALVMELLALLALAKKKEGRRSRAAKGGPLPYFLTARIASAVGMVLE
jgi:hypothetical protein